MTHDIQRLYARAGFFVLVTVAASCLSAVFAVLYFETVIRQSPPVLEACTSPKAKG